MTAALVHSKSTLNLKYREKTGLNIANFQIVDLDFPNVASPALQLLDVGYLLDENLN